MLADALSHEGQLPFAKLDAMTAHIRMVSRSRLSKQRL